MNNDLDAFKRDTRNFFATGTGLQELYVTPRLLSDQHWDVLAETVRWTRRQAPVLVDSHWVGGDPNQGEVYGFTSWAPGRAVLMLRNPKDEPQTYQFDLGTALELPDGSPSAWILKRPWAEDADRPSLKIRAGESFTVSLDPLEVAVWQGTPEKDSAPYRYTGYEEAARGFLAPREAFVGSWEYTHQGSTYRRVFHADGSCMLHINGQPYSGWAGFTWRHEDGIIYIVRPDGTVDGEHQLKDPDTLLFLTNPYGPATKVQPPSPTKE
jgi:hypothetical protein